MRTLTTDGTMPERVRVRPAAPISGGGAGGGIITAHAIRSSYAGGRAHEPDGAQRFGAHP
jgi:hypothetical protein